MTCRLARGGASPRGLAMMAMLTSLLTLALALAAGAAPLEIRGFAAGRYVSGGVGADEQAEMESLRGRFNLRILTARRATGFFLADAEVSITRGSETVLETRMDGPLMLVELPPGTYRVRVTTEGKSQEQEVQIVRGEGRELYLYWD